MTYLATSIGVQSIEATVEGLDCLIDTQSIHCQFATVKCRYELMRNLLGVKTNPGSVR